VPGRPGTLVKRNLDVGHHLAAKTGYIRGVFSLSGFLFGQTDTFAFSFIVNGCGSGTRAYELFNSLLNTIYSWDAGEALALPAGMPGKAGLQN
jgi:D-alanyl-D-alanine carboxypeptidase